MKRRGFFRALIGAPAVGASAACLAAESETPKHEGKLVFKVSCDTSELRAELNRIQEQIEAIQRLPSAQYVNIQHLEHAIAEQVRSGIHIQ